MKVRLSERARAELIDAFDWYEAEEPGLGFKFRNAVAETSELAAQYPDWGTLVTGAIRRKLVHPYPHSL